MADAEEPNENVILYLDNSNMFINACQHAAQLLRFRVPTDTRCRIDVGRMVDIACHGRKALRAKLYGSEPPMLDTVWQAIRDKDIEVSHFKRSVWNNREKETDTTLTADAVDDLGELKDIAGPNRAMILFSGDKDMLPTLRKAQKHEWRIEIWSFKSALANEIKKAYPDIVAIHYIDDHFNEVTYTASRWDHKRFRIPADRTMVLKFDSTKWKEWLLRSNFDKILDKILNSVVERTSQLFRLPTMACWHDLDPDDSSISSQLRNFYHLAVICVPPERKETKTPPLYNFTELYQYKDTIRTQFSNAGCIHTQTFLQYREGAELDGADDLEVFEYADKIPLEEFGWTVVAPERRRTMQRYTEDCVHGYRCRMGASCQYGHTAGQKEYFKEMPDESRRRYYKTKLCWHGTRCNYRARSHLCSYAHGLIEASCLICNMVGEHWMDECPQKQR